MHTAEERATPGAGVRHAATPGAGEEAGDGGASPCGLVSARKEGHRARTPLVVSG